MGEYLYRPEEQNMYLLKSIFCRLTQGLAGDFFFFFLILSEGMQVGEVGRVEAERENPKQASCPPSAEPDFTTLRS